MNKYDPKIHHRRSIRLKGYDYSQKGMYYITICIKDRACLLGKIENDQMILNDAGVMVDSWWKKIPGKFPDIQLDEYQIMPNHFHAIIVNVGVDPCVNPTPRWANNHTGEHDEHLGEHDEHLGEHMGSPLHEIIRWFKTMSTNEYIRNVKSNNWRPFNKKLFQRNYYENIIRDERAYQNIVAYIRNNPANWNKDKFHM